MRLTLERGDLRREYKDIPFDETSFEHFADSAQDAIKLVNHAYFREYNHKRHMSDHNMIYLPFSHRSVGHAEIQAELCRCGHPVGDHGVKNGDSHPSSSSSNGFCGCVFSMDEAAAHLQVRPTRSGDVKVPPVSDKAIQVTSPVSVQVEQLKKAINEAGGPSAAHVVVHNPHLALVLDRLETLEALEEALEETKSLGSHFETE